MRKKAIIFDLDGVLIDSEYHSIRKLVDFSEWINHPISFETAKLTAGVGYGHYETLLGELLHMKDECWKKAFYAYRKAHFHWDYRKLINADALKLLAYLKTTGVKLALASASVKEELKEKIEPTKLKDYFDVVLSAQTLTHTKPDPEIYLKALELLECKKEECVAIEDSTTGIRAAHDAGIMVIARYDPRIGNDTSLADRVVEDLGTLIPEFACGIL